MIRIHSLSLLLWMLLCGVVGHSQDTAARTGVPAEDPLLQPTPGLHGQIPKDKTKPPVFKWDAGVGYAAYLPPMKRGCWYPVWVKVEAVTAAVRGEAVLTQPEYPIEVRIPFSVEKGAVKLYRSYYKLTPCSGYETHAALQAEIRVKRQPPQTIPLDYRVAHMNAQHVLILGDETGAFNFLNQARRDGPEESAPVALEGSVIYGKVELLPEDPIALEAVDAIIINGAVVRRITAEQWGVMRDWIARGGRLLLAGGAHQPFIEQSALAGAYGLKTNPPRMERVSILEGGADPAVPESGVLVAAPEEGAIQWDWVWVGDTARPLVAGKRVGKGWFEYCAFDLSAGNLQRLSKWGEAPLLWQEILERSALPGPMDQIAENGDQAIEKGLENTFVIYLAPLGWVFVYLLLYNLLALPVNRWICRRYKRPEWSWTILIGVAVCFAVFGYYSGLARQSRSFQVNELLLVRKETDAPSARATAVDVVFSPGRFRADVQAAGLMFPAPIPQTAALPPISGRGRPPSYPTMTGYFGDSGLALTFGGQTILNQVTLFPFAAKSYVSEFTLENAGRIAARGPVRLSRPGPGWPIGQLVNETPWTFERCWLGDGTVFWEHASPWRPGETLDLVGMTPLAEKPGWQNLVDRVLWDSFMKASAVPQPGSATEMPGRLPSGVRQPAFAGYSDVWGDYQSRYRRDGRFYFWGEADAEAGNLFASVHRGIRMRRLLFEQPVEVDRGASGNRRGQAQTLDCTFRIVGVGGAPSQDPNVYAYGPRRMLPEIPLDQVAIDIYSYPPPGPGRLRSMTLSFRLESGQKFYKESGSGPYLLAGCPVALYNWRRQKWDSGKEMAGEVWKIENPEDYAVLQDVFRIHILVDARPNSILYKREGDTTPKPALINGRDLNGDQKPQNGSGRGLVRDAPIDELPPGVSLTEHLGVLPISARIERLSVAIERE